MLRPTAGVRSNVLGRGDANHSVTTPSPALLEETHMHQEDDAPNALPLPSASETTAAQHLSSLQQSSSPCPQWIKSWQRSGS
jgi:hypothetical protein